MRAVEALHAAFAFPPDVLLQDGGTLGLALYDAISSARRVLVLDAIDFRLPRGTLARAPRRRGARLGPREDLAAPDRIQRRPRACAIEWLRAGDDRRHRRPAGRARRFRRQPHRPRARAPRRGRCACRARARSVGVSGRAAATRRRRSSASMRRSLALDAYESGRPSTTEACRIGDPRVLGGPRARRRTDHVHRHPDAGRDRGRRVRRLRGPRRAPGARCQARRRDAAGETWVLAFQGAAVRMLTAAEAAQTNAALDALDALQCGRERHRRAFRRPRRARAAAARSSARKPLMTIAMPLAAGADPLAYPLIAQLFTRHGYTDVTVGQLRRVHAAPGTHAAACSSRIRCATRRRSTSR